MLACSKTKDALLIDPVKELIERDLNLINQLDLKVRNFDLEHLIQFCLYNFFFIIFIFD